MLCVRCGKTIPDNAKVCPECGASQVAQSMQSAISDQPMSMGEWMITMLLTAIPVVGIIMLFVWAFGGGAAPSKKNWARAALVWMAISVVLAILCSASIASMIMRMAY